MRRHFNWFFVAAAASFLVWQLSSIGWADVWASRPHSPLFYLFVVLAYLTLPTADMLIYRRLWRLPRLATWGVCLRKRIYNSALVGYSGEVFLLLWARPRVRRAGRQLAHEIKDSNILSGVASNLLTAGLIVYLLVQGELWEAAVPAFEWWALATLVLAALTPAAFLLRRHFMVLSAAEMREVLAIHAVRLCLVQFLVLAQWRAALPAAPLGTLVSLLAVQLLVSRIPMVPNRDLLFISIGIALAGDLAVPQAQIASLLLTAAALQQVLHLVVMIATSVPLGIGTRRALPDGGAAE